MIRYCSSERESRAEKQRAHSTAQQAEEEREERAAEASHSMVSVVCGPLGPTFISLTRGVLTAY